MTCDPQVPADGTCAQCGKPRRPERSRTYGKQAAEIDPFCSTECAKEHHHVTIPTGSYTTSGNPAGHRKTGPHSFRPGRGRLA